MLHAPGLLGVAAAGAAEKAAAPASIKTSEIVVISFLLMCSALPVVCFGLTYELHSAGALAAMTWVAAPGGSRYTT